MCGHAIESGPHDGRRVQPVFGALEAIQTLVPARILTQGQTEAEGHSRYTSGLLSRSTLPVENRGNRHGRSPPAHSPPAPSRSTLPVENRGSFQVRYASSAPLPPEECPLCVYRHTCVFIRTKRRQLPRSEGRATERRLRRSSRTSRSSNPKGCPRRIATAGARNERETLALSG
jgi:hypothetical protein